jgi:hypothetical protein
MLPRRRILSAISAFFALIVLLPAAHASIARALRLAELVKASEQVVVGVPVEAWSRWEEVASSRRIVTYTRVRVEETVGGAPTGSEVLVRTLGGQVDKIGQVVYGEAILSHGERSLLFLHQASDGKTLVAGMAQGHFPLKADTQGVYRLHASPHLAELVGRPDSAVARLTGQTVGDCHRLIAEALRQ